MKRAVVLGATVILLFSFWPLRAINALCCLGVILGGLTTGLLRGRSQGGSLEPVLAMRLGAMAGIVASVVALGLNALSAEGLAPLPPLDPIPEFIYTFLNGMWEGLRDLPNRQGSDWADSPGYWTRLAFQLPSNGLFGGFGGAVASTMFESAGGKRWRRA